MKNYKSISKLLESLNLIDVNHVEVLSESTRDNPNLQVLRDKKSGVVFIDNYYTGNKTYEDGTYRGNLNSERSTNFDYEDIVDTNRRIKTFLSTLLVKQFATLVVGKANSC